MSSGPWELPLWIRLLMALELLVFKLDANRSDAGGGSLRISRHQFGALWLLDPVRIGFLLPSLFCRHNCRDFLLHKYRH
jgi:hypothetical protein